MIEIKATAVSAPPAWALIERNLIELMEQSARLFTRKYTERGGGTLLAEDLDDLYEQFYNFGLFYAIGAADDLLDLHLQQWNAATRISDDSIRHRPNLHDDFVKVYRPSIHNEFWNLEEAAEWHHLGEGGTAFYHMGVADPTISENVRRARRFAAMFIGEDPEAPNWDPDHRNCIVQAGAFGEHRFTRLRYHEDGRDSDTVMPVDAKYFAVDLPPSTSIRVEAGLNRFVNTTSYAFPWYGDRSPVPFQT